jgi:hypothetical protein
VYNCLVITQETYKQNFEIREDKWVIMHDNTVQETITGFAAVDV